MTTDPVDALLASCLEHKEEDWSEALENCCTRRPELAEELRRRFACMQRVGLIETPRGKLPSRLGKYHIESALGTGSMGKVFAAVDVELGRQVVLKTIRPDQLPYGDARERFRREMLAASQIEHPAICAIFEAGEIEGSQYLAMPFLTRRTLERWIKTDGAAGLGPARKQSETLCDWFATLAEGLQAVHDSGFVHRDVKPANILVPESGHPVLVDFGLVRAIEAEQGSGLTASGSLVGTPAYMAPEQIEEQHRVGPCTDIYSLGLCLRECLLSQPAFTASGREALYHQILESDLTAPHKLRRSVPADLSMVVSTATARDPGARYACAADFAADLRRVQRCEQIQAKSPPLPLRTRRWIQRHPVVSSTLIVSLIALSISLWLMFRAIASGADARAFRLVHNAMEVQQEQPDQALGMLAEALGLSRDPIVLARCQEVMHMLYDSRHIQIPGASQLTSARWSPDGKYFVCSGTGIDTRIYTATGQPVKTIERSSTPRQGHNFAFRGGDVAVGHLDGSVGLYDLTTGQRRRLLIPEKNPGAIHRVYASANHILAIGFRPQSYTARVWTGRDLRETPLQGPPNSASSAAVLLPSGRFLWNNRVYAHTGEIVQELASAQNLAIDSADVLGPTVVLASCRARSPRVLVFKEEDGKLLLQGQLARHGLVGGCVRLLPRKSLTLVLGTMRGRLETFASRGGSNGLTLTDMARSHKGSRVSCLDLDADSALVAVGTEQGYIEVFDSRGNRVHTMRGHDGPVRSVHFSPGSKQTLLSSAWDGTVRIWNLHARPSLQLSNAAGKPARIPGRAEAWIFRGRQQLTRINAGLEVLETSQLAASAHSAWVGNDGAVLISHFSETTFVSEHVNGHTSHLPLSTGARVLFNRCYRLADGRLLLRNQKRQVVTSTSSEKNTLFDPRPPAACQYVAASRDGKLVAAAYWTSPATILVYQLNGQPWRRFQVPGVVHGMEFAADRSYLAIASTDRWARIFDLRKDGVQEPLRVGPHRGGANSVTFAPDCRLLASVSGDGMLRVVEVSSQATVFEVRAHHTSALAVQFFDCTRLITTGRDGMAKRWSLDHGDVLAEVRRLMR